MIKLSNSQRQYLRRMAHDLRPTAQLGKLGLTPAFIASIEQELNARELIKVKLMDFRDQKQAIIDELCSTVDATHVSSIGNTAILYREHRDPERREIILPWGE